MQPALDYTAKTSLLVEHIIYGMLIQEKVKIYVALEFRVRPRFFEKLLFFGFIHVACVLNTGTCKERRFANPCRGFVKQH